MKTGSRDYYSSSSFRLAVFFTLVLGFGIAVMAYFGYYFSHGRFIHSTEKMLETDIAWFDDIPSVHVLQRAVDVHAAAPHRVYLLLAPDGHKLAGNLDTKPYDVKLLSENTITFAFGPEQRQYAARFRTLPHNGLTLLAGIDITDEARDYHRMQTLSILTIISMGLVIFLSFSISTQFVRRTNRITRTAKAIVDTGDMTRRIKVDSCRDDLGYLSDVLNEFLARNEALLKGIKQVSDNVAHDLRTPLTRLRNNLETLRRDLRGQDGEQARVDDLIAEADHLLDTFAALMRIAHVETGARRAAFKDVDLMGLAQDVIDLYDPLADQKGVRLHFTGTPAHMTGDRDLLFQAIANLIDNAIKFTPAGGHVDLTLARQDSMISIEVSDSGRGISDTDKPHVFERFYRSHDCCRNTPGNGLGLALVGAVVELHHGKIKLGDAAPTGLVVTILLPAA